MRCWMPVSEPGFRWIVWHKIWRISPAVKISDLSRKHHNFGGRNWGFTLWLWLTVATNAYVACGFFRPLRPRFHKWRFDRFHNMEPTRATCFFGKSSGTPLDGGVPWMSNLGSVIFMCNEKNVSQFQLNRTCHRYWNNIKIYVQWLTVCQVCLHFWINGMINPKSILQLDQAMAGSSGDLETDALVPAGVCTPVFCPQRTHPFQRKNIYYITKNMTCVYIYMTWVSSIEIWEYVHIQGHVFLLGI